MNEIRCPNCKTVFQIDEKNYDSIVKQIRDNEFQKELEIREKQFNSDKENAIKLAEVNIEKTLNEKINSLNLKIIELENENKNNQEVKDNEIKNLEHDLEKKYNGQIEKLILENNKLQNDLKLKDSENKFNLEKVINEREKDIDSLKNQIEISKNEFIYFSSG